MADPRFTAHATQMLQERNIELAWVSRAIEAPDKIITDTSDGNIHYIKRIPERDNRLLRVVVNEQEASQLVVTVFFDRRLKE